MQDVLAGCLEGQTEAWDAFVERYAPVIFAAVRRALRSRGARGEDPSAEDAVQEVFLRLIRNDLHLLRSYDPRRASLATWLTIVARSTAIDLLRRRRPAAIPLDRAPPVAAAERKPPLGDPTADLPAGLLTARQKLVLHLLFDRDMDVAAAAGVLGVSPQTVRTTKHKAIRKLRQHFAVEDSS